MNICIGIDEEFLQLFGDGSLIGKIANSNIPLVEIESVKLIFHETSNRWREKNKGPAQ